MAFTPGHSAVVAYALETGTITESTDGVTPAALPAIPSNPIVVGYTNVPEVTKRYNNRIGYAVGAAEGLYKARGRIEPEISFEIRLGALAFLQQCVRDSSGDLPHLAIFVGVRGEWTDVYRMCKCAELTLNFAEGEGGGELTASTRFWGQAVQAGSALNPSVASLRALGTPLLWHDVRTFKIGDTDYRSSLTRQSWTINHNLERKHSRPNFGDNEPLSRTSYALLPHHVTVTGETGLSQKLPASLFTAAVTSQDWGDVEIYATDEPAIPDGQTPKSFTVKGIDVMPDGETQQGVESSAQMTHSVNVVARNISVVTA